VRPVKESRSVAEFCGAYSVGKTVAYEKMNAGRMIARKRGRRTVILRSDAEAWARSLQERPAA
jgi:hypothetical protein